MGVMVICGVPSTFEDPNILFVISEMGINSVDNFALVVGSEAVNSSFDVPIFDKK